MIGKISPCFWCLDSLHHLSSLTCQVATDRRLQKVGCKTWNIIDMGLSDRTLIESGFENHIFASFKLKWRMDWKCSQGLTTPLSPSQGPAQTLTFYLCFQISFMRVPVHAEMRSHTRSFLHKYHGFIIHHTRNISWYMAGQEQTNTGD